MYNRSMWSVYGGVILLAAATLVFEITLTRVFSIAQWYHFGFMAVSVALLGFGASGTLLSLQPSQRQKSSPRSLSILSTLFAVSALGGYLVVNYLPFDSYRIAWERKQLLYLIIYYLSLVVPFTFSGLTVGVLLSEQPGQASVIYAANLAGSGAGCLLALGSLSLLGAPSTVMLTALIGLLAALTFSLPHATEPARITLHASRITLLAALILLSYFTLHPPSITSIRMSPYKTLSTVLRFPDTRRVYSQQNAFSQVDVVASSAIKSAPGLSFRYPGGPPPQMGLTVDGDNLSPITTELPAADQANFTDYLPTALPYLLKPDARALIINPRGGLDVWVALQHGVREVTVVEDNPLVVEAVRETSPEGGGAVYDDPRVKVIIEAGRSYTRRTQRRYDVVHLSLSDSFKVVNYGAYSLTESTLYTVEALQDFYARLADGGWLVVPRWLQLPPSEEVRAAAVIVAALHRSGVEQPEAHLAAFRSFQTMMLLVKRGPISDGEIATIRDFCTRLGYDLVAYPGMAADEANRYNLYDEPVYYEAVRQILSPERDRFFQEHPYDVRPPVDDRPFFFHFFRWSQVPVIFQSFGKTWQPFGGGGYLVLIVLLIFAILASATLILLPLAVSGTQNQPRSILRSRWTLVQRLLRRAVEIVCGPRRRTKVRREQENAGPKPRTRLRVFAYFALLGFGFLFIEVPLMQRFILFLGHPIYAFATVLFAVLVFSGLGSRMSPRVPLPWALAVLVACTLVYPFLLPRLFRLLLAQSLAMRLLASVVMLAPVSVLMGMPFPKGIVLISETAPGLVPWAWGINGCTSVLSSILSVMIAVSFGFSWVLRAAGVAYALALVAIPRVWVRRIANAHL